MSSQKGTLCCLTQARSAHSSPRVRATVQASLLSHLPRCWHWHVRVRHQAIYCLHILIQTSWPRACHESSIGRLRLNLKEPSGSTCAKPESMGGGAGPPLLTRTRIVGVYGQQLEGGTKQDSASAQVVLGQAQAGTASGWQGRYMSVRWVPVGLR